MAKLLRRESLVAVCLAAGTLALYARVWQFKFLNFDDDIYVTANSRVLSGLSLENVLWAFQNIHANFWHPLTTLSLMLDAELFGTWAGGFHITNVVLHTATTLLLFFVLRRMTGAAWQSAFVAAVFAWHPLHVESVAWVAERKDVLSGFFWMLTMWAYARYAERPMLANYLVLFTCFALGLMSKPMLVTLPFVLLLLDYWPLGRLRIGQRTAGAVLQSPVPVRRLIGEKVPLLALSAIFSAVAIPAQGTAVTSLAMVPVWVRLVNIPRWYVSYIKKTFWPDDLAVFYPYPREISVILIAAAAFLLLTILWAVIRWGRRAPYLPVGWFWFLGTLVPVIGIVQIGGFAIADRFMYLPLIGLSIMVTWGVSELSSALKLRPLAIVGSSAALIACVVVSSFQLRHWKDSVSLFIHTGRVAPSALAHYNLAGGYADIGEDEKAIEHYRAAVNIKPDLAVSWNNLGILLFKAGKIDEAVQNFRRAVQADPQLASAHNNLGNALSAQEQFGEAIWHYEIALRLNPHNPRVRENLRKAIELQQDQ